MHDLIPVLHAAYEGSHFQHWFGGMLKSLRPNDHVLSVSHATKNELCNYFPIDPAKVFVVHNAASPDMFYRVGDVDEISRVRRSFGIPDGAHYVLSLNSLEPRKNLGHAVRSFARLVEQERVRDLYLVLAGPRGEHSQALAAAIAGSMIARERVIFTGYVPDGDLAALYSGALFFVFPSLYEGFGLPVLEAMQCGVPVVTSNTSSLPEVAGDAGVLVDPSDADALPQAMLELYRDAERRRELTARGLARARTFSWERCAAQTVAAYRTALGS